MTPDHRARQCADGVGSFEQLFKVYARTDARLLKSEDQILGRNVAHSTGGKWTTAKAGGRGIEYSHARLMRKQGIRHAHTEGVMAVERPSGLRMRACVHERQKIILDLHRISPAGRVTKRY